MDNFIIGLLGGVNILGYYSQARYLIDASNTIIAPVSQSVSFPVYSKVQDNDVKLKEAHRIQNYFLIRIMLPISLIIFLFPTELIMLLFGEKWKVAASAMRWLALYPAIMAVFQNLKMLLYSIERVGATIYVYLVQILVAISLITLGFNYFSIQGAAIGFMITIILGTLSIYIYSWKYTSESLKANVLAPLFSSLVTSIIIFYLKNYYLHKPTLIMLFGLGVMTVILYLAVLFFIERRSLIKNILIIYNHLSSSIPGTLANKYKK